SPARAPSFPPPQAGEGQGGGFLGGRALTAEPGAGPDDSALLSGAAGVIDPGRAVEHPALVGVRESRATASVDRDGDRVGQVTVAIGHRTEDPVGTDPSYVDDAARARGLIELGL